MPNIKKFEPVWVTKEGTPIPIKAMATPHLLNAIHLIERARMQSLINIQQNDVAISRTDEIDILNHYCAWPEGYSDLLTEAEKRQLIKRK